MRSHTLKTLALALGIPLAAIALSIPARAASLRQGAAASGAEVTGSLPGEVLWGYYQTNDSTYGDGDSILRLINPNGSANTNLGEVTQTVCAMIYVFDEEQEMGECCGCPLTSAQLATFSAYKNLTSNWGLSEIDEFFGASNGYGSFAVVAAAPNAPLCTHQSGACNGGCDPTNTPGYGVSNQSNLLGSVTQLESQTRIEPGTSFEIVYGPSNVKEVALFDDAGGDPSNLTYLQEQCGALVGNGTEGGICSCPSEVPLTPLITD